MGVEKAMNVENVHMNLGIVRFQVQMSWIQWAFNVHHEINYSLLRTNSPNQPMGLAQPPQVER